MFAFFFFYNMAHSTTSSQTNPKLQFYFALAPFDVIDSDVRTTNSRNFFASQVAEQIYNTINLAVHQTSTTQDDSEPRS